MSEDAAVGFAQAPAAAKMDSVRRLVGEAHVSRAFRFQGSRPTVSKGVLFETTGDRLEATDLASGQRRWSWDDARSEEGERRLHASGSGERPRAHWHLGRSRDQFRRPDRTNAMGSLRERCVSLATVMAGGRIFTGLEDGSLVVFETGDPNDDGWPMWGGGPAHNGSTSALDSYPAARIEEVG